MSNWPSVKARRLLAALLEIGWQLKRQAGSHRTLSREGWPDYVFAFHDGEEIGRLAGELLVKLGNGHPVQRTHVEVPSELVHRESS